MTVITTRLTVGPDGVVSVAAPLPAGDYTVSIKMRATPDRGPVAEPFDADLLPRLDLGPRASACAAMTFTTTRGERRRHQRVGAFQRQTQLHDANIVATMLAHGATRLLTFSAAGFRRFAGLIDVVSP